MKKRYALFIALLVTLVFAGNFIFFSSVKTERETVIINRVLDGDTVKLEDGRTVRFLNINTPEKGTPGANEATMFLSQYINHTVELEPAGTEKYGRTLGRVYYGDAYLNWEIVRNGLGNVFLANENDLKSFHVAQEKAIDEGLGIWSHSPFYGCTKMTINIKDEFVDLDVVCNVSIEGWTLSDESTKKYVFAGTREKRIRIYSGYGQDSATEKFWNKGDVWNNDRDSAMLRDTKGLLVDFYSYGY
jgi:endonuclease YncB( thermonuclease family)